MSEALTEAWAPVAESLTPMSEAWVLWPSHVVPIAEAFAEAWASVAESLMPMAEA